MQHGILLAHLLCIKEYRTMFEIDAKQEKSIIHEMDEKNSMNVSWKRKFASCNRYTQDQNYFAKSFLQIFKKYLI